MRDAITVHLPQALLGLFPTAPPKLHLRAATVEDLLAQLENTWPGMQDRLRDSTPKIRRHIKIIAGDEPATLETSLAPGCEVHILTAVSGG